MKNFKRIALVLALAFALVMMTGCDGITSDVKQTLMNGEKLSQHQPTPSDIEYSLERYNLIRRTYWVNGMRERANTLPCEIDKPLGYVVLFAGNATVGSFVVDGKVSSLNSFLTPDSEYYSSATTGYNDWLPDVDGSYGQNDSGIFFFTPDGKYIEWNGEYLYSDIPFVVDAPMVTYAEVDRE